MTNASTAPTTTNTVSPHEKKGKQKKWNKKIEYKLVSFHRFLTIITAFLLGISTFSLSYSQVLYVPDEFITNYLYTYNPFEKADSRITLITIEEDTLQKYGALSTWSRSTLAQAVDALSENGAAVIALDLDLSESKDAAGDASLVEACKNAKNVVAMSSAGFDSKLPQPEMNTDETTENKEGNLFPHEFTIQPADSSMLWNEHSAVSIRFPYDALAKEVTIGTSNAVKQSADGSIRSAALKVSYNGKDYDSFSAAVYKLYQDSIGEEYRLPTLDKEELFGFNSIWNTSSYQTIRFCDLLEGNYDASLIQGSIALVGEYTPPQSQSYFNYLLDRDNQQEVLVEAGILQTLLTQHAVHDVPPLVQAILYTILITSLYFLLSRRRNIFSILIYVFVLICGASLAHTLNSHGYRFLLLIPTIFVVISFMCSVIQNSLYNIIEKKRMEKTLRLYMDASVVDQISEVAPFSLATLSERRNIAVLFVDIRGFTTLSEELDPADVVELLNQYFTVVYASIQAWNGTLDKFIGDAAMAIFNAPNEQENYILHAVCAAHDILLGFQPIKSLFYERFGREINIGLGINCGEAIVGNIGCMGRMDYTAIGDVVNTASRLESSAAAGQILISEAVQKAIADDITVSPIGPLALKGKTKAVEAYQLDAINKPAAPNSKAGKEFLNEVRLLYSKMGSNFPVLPIFPRK